MDTSIYRTGTLPPDFTKAFKDADIRGEYGKEIDARVAYRTMAAFIMCCNVTRIVIGRDMRVSSPELHDACVAAARDMGATVLDIGMVTTPTMYYVSGTEQIHGVMVTASHNPAKYNGLKFVLPGAIPITKKTGLQVMLQLVKKNSFIYAPKRGGLKKKNTIPAYQKHILAAASLDKKVTSSIAIDIDNNLWVLVDKNLLKVDKIRRIFVFVVLEIAKKTILLPILESIKSISYYKNFDVDIGQFGRTPSGLGVESNLNQTPTLEVTSLKNCLYPLEGNASCGVSSVNQYKVLVSINSELEFFTTYGTYDSWLAIPSQILQDFSIFEAMYKPAECLSLSILPPPQPGPPQLEELYLSI